MEVTRAAAKQLGHAFGVRVQKVQKVQRFDTPYGVRVVVGALQEEGAPL